MTKLTLINTDQEVVKVNSLNPSRLLEGLGDNIESLSTSQSDLYFYFSAIATKENKRASRMAGCKLYGDVYISLEPLKLPKNETPSNFDFKGDFRLVNS